MVFDAIGNHVFHVTRYTCTRVDSGRSHRYSQSMNKTISLSFASLFYAPASFYRDHAAKDYQRLICNRSDVEALFHDDEVINDGSPLFDEYAFNAWNDEQHNEKDYQQTLAEYANAVRFLPKFRDDEKEPPRCDCHRYKRWCGICRPY